MKFKILIFLILKFKFYSNQSISSNSSNSNRSNFDNNPLIEQLNQTNKLIFNFDLQSSSSKLFQFPPPSSTSSSTSSSDLINKTFITLNICSSPNSISNYLIENILIISNSSEIQNPNLDQLKLKSNSLNSKGGITHSIAGFANLTISNSIGLWIKVQTPNLNQNQQNQQNQNWSFQLAISNQFPIHSVNRFPAFKLEDTDQNTALLTAADSSLFLPQSQSNPLSLESFKPIIIQTPLSISFNLSASTCYLQSINSSSPSHPISSISTSLTTRTTGIGMSSSQKIYSDSKDLDFRISSDQAGQRTQYLINNLNSNQNYSAWLFQQIDSINNIQIGRLWPYINFRTKSSSNCKLVYNLPFCPSVAYSIPTSPTQSIDSILKSYNQSISGNMSNFANVLSSYPCNNDTSGRYSFVAGCGDCLKSYNDWLCAVSMPRCTDPPQNFTPILTIPNDPQIILNRLDPQKSRTPQLSINAFPYGEIPPCESTCTLVAATCPPLIGWQCPITGLTAQSSYGQPASLTGLEVMGGEQTGAGGGGQRAGDRFGNVYCNALGSDMAYARQGSAISLQNLSNARFINLILGTFLIIYL